jgi:hypothetical protein
MVDIDDVPFLPGETVTAARVNGRFTEIVTGLNDLPSYSMLSETLTNVHLPSFVVDETYLGATIEPVNKGIGTPTSLLFGVPGYPFGATSTDLTVDFGSVFPFGMNTGSKVGAVLVLFDADIAYASYVLNAGSVIHRVEISQDMAIWVELSITEHQKYPIYNNVTDANANISSRTVVTSDDIDTAGFVGLRGIRIKLGFGVPLAVTAIVTNEVRVNAASFSVIPLHAEVV